MLTLFSFCYEMSASLPWCIQDVSACLLRQEYEQALDIIEELLSASEGETTHDFPRLELLVLQCLARHRAGQLASSQTLGSSLLIDLQHANASETTPEMSNSLELWMGIVNLELARIEAKFAEDSTRSIFTCGHTGLSKRPSSRIPLTLGHYKNTLENTNYFLKLDNR